MPRIVVANLRRPENGRLFDAVDGRNAVADGDVALEFAARTCGRAR